MLPTPPRVFPVVPQVTALVLSNTYSESKLSSSTIDLGKSSLLMLSPDLKSVPCVVPCMRPSLLLPTAIIPALELLDPIASLAYNNSFALPALVPTAIATTTLDSRSIAPPAFDSIATQGSIPSSIPSAVPSPVPSIIPRSVSSAVPSVVPSMVPSPVPSSFLTAFNSIAAVPNIVPRSVPSSIPTAFDLIASSPAFDLIAAPTSVPSSVPSTVPSLTPSLLPRSVPGSVPSVVPGLVPSSVPSSIPNAFDLTASSLNAYATPFAPTVHSYKPNYLDALIQQATRR